MTSCVKPSIVHQVVDSGVQPYCTIRTVPLKIILHSCNVHNHRSVLSGLLVLPVHSVSGTETPWPTGARSRLQARSGVHGLLALLVSTFQQPHRSTVVFLLLNLDLQSSAKIIACVPEDRV